MTALSSNWEACRLSFLTPFDNPLAPDVPPREGIEGRALVFH